MGTTDPAAPEGRESGPPPPVTRQCVPVPGIVTGLVTYTQGAGKRELPGQDIARVGGARAGEFVTAVRTVTPAISR